MQKKLTIKGKTAFSNEQNYVLWNDEISLEDLNHRDHVVLMEKETYLELEPHVRRVKKCGHWSEYRIDYIDRIFHLTKVRSFEKNSDEGVQNIEGSDNIFENIGKIPDVDCFSGQKVFGRSDLTLDDRISELNYQRIAHMADFNGR